MNRALTSLSACNRALLRATDESELIYAICRICVEIGGYRMAWVGHAEHDAEKSVRPVAEVGVDDGYLEQTPHQLVQQRSRTRADRDGDSHADDGHHARDIMDNPYFAPWRENALRHGFQSSIALPLLVDDEALGRLEHLRGRPQRFRLRRVGLARGVR